MNAACRLASAEGALHSSFEWGRIQTNADWILPIAALLAAFVFVRAMYRRDAAELSPLLSWFLTALRAAAFLGLLIFYLQPQWRTEREIVRNSRVLLLVDTSLSMGLSDAEAESSRRLPQPALGKWPPRWRRPIFSPRCARPTT